MKKLILLFSLVAPSHLFGSIQLISDAEKTELQGYVQRFKDQNTQNAERAILRETIRVITSEHIVKALRELYTKMGFCKNDTLCSLFEYSETELINPFGEKLFTQHSNFDEIDSWGFSCKKAIGFIKYVEDLEDLVELTSKSVKIACSNIITSCAFLQNILEEYTLKRILDEVKTRALLVLENLSIQDDDDNEASNDGTLTPLSYATSTIIPMDTKLDSDSSSVWELENPFPTKRKKSNHYRKRTGLRDMTNLMPQPGTQAYKGKSKSKVATPSKPKLRGKSKSIKSKSKSKSKKPSLDQEDPELENQFRTESKSEVKYRPLPLTPIPVFLTPVPGESEEEKTLRIKQFALFILKDLKNQEKHRASWFSQLTDSQKDQLHRQFIQRYLGTKNTDSTSLDSASGSDDDFTMPSVLQEIFSTRSIRDRSGG